ncbi:MAG: response regulator [Planctomycetaceae bacterium]
MARPHVVVIDDDPLFRSLLASMLRKEFLVSVAADGAEGYYKALEHPPHLAIIDIQMPGWDGLRTLKAFRTHYQLSHVPVMITTGDGSQETLASAMQAGANDFVVKATLSKEEFLRKVASLTLPVECRAGDAPAAPGNDNSHGSSPTIESLLNELHGVGSTAPVATCEELTEDDLLQSIVDNWD